MFALKEMQGDRYNGTLESMERDIVNVVWNRTKLPMNEKNKNLIKDAVVESFIDMSNDGGMVCSNGRCARLLESLVHTDADQSAVTGAMTVEQIRNDALQKSNDILKETVKQYSSSALDETLAAAAKSYDDPSIEVTDDIDKKFKTIIKDKVNRFIDLTYIDKLSTRDFNNIKSHCLTAIDSI